MVAIDTKPTSRRVRLRGLWRQTPVSFRIGTVVLILHLLVAVTGPYWAPYGYL